MKPVEEYLAECLSAVKTLPAMELPLVEAVDCVLAEDIMAGVSIPRFDNSAMDGYAVLMVDVAAASESHPVSLPVVADLPAGPSEPMRMVSGTAVRIMTGAPVPEAADAIVPVEWTDAGLNHVVINQAPVAGQFIRPIIALPESGRRLPPTKALISSVFQPRLISPK